MTELMSLRDKVLLFAEDEEIIRDQTLDILNVLFKEVIVAIDGQEALEKYVDYKPDVVFTDIKMPHISGLDLLNEIRKDDPIIPVILFSAYSDHKYLLKAINLGISGYVIKPAKLDDLFTVFAKCAKAMHALKPHIVTITPLLSYHIHSNELIKNGERISLTAKEHALLSLMIQKYPHILTKDEAIQIVWDGEEITDSAMKNIVAKLRNKLGHDIIKSISGVGWRLETDHF